MRRYHEKTERRSKKAVMRCKMSKMNFSQDAEIEKGPIFRV